VTRTLATRFRSIAHEVPARDQEEAHTMSATTESSLGMSEKELRDALVDELDLAFRTEGNTATIHAVAHSVARVIMLDHLRIAEQLEKAGVSLPERTAGDRG
jgi:hypothetical protein